MKAAGPVQGVILLGRNATTVSEYGGGDAAGLICSNLAAKVLHYCP